MRPEITSPLRDTVVREIKRATFFAVLASAFALIRVLMSKGDWVDLLFVAIVAGTYFVGAVLAGVVFGALSPIRNSALGSAVAGSLAALAPFSLIILVIVKLGNVQDISLSRLAALVVVTATIAGAPYGYARGKYDRES